MDQITFPKPKFSQGEHVQWSELAGIKAGSGIVCGTATAPQPVLGQAYIIELNEPVPRYPYSHVIIFECQLTLVGQGKIVRLGEYCVE